MAALTITGTPPAAVVGQFYAWGPTVSGGTPPYTFASTSAEAAGLTYDPIANLVSGVPTTVEALTGLTFAVTDSAVSSPGVPAPATATLTVGETVTASTAPPTPTAIAYDASSPAITGKGQPGAVVIVSVDAAAIFGASIVQPNGQWRHQLGSPLSPYVAHAVTALQVAFGQQSPASAALNVAVSATAPAAPIQPPPLGGPSTPVTAPGGGSAYTPPVGGGSAPTTYSTYSLPLLRSTGGALAAPLHLLHA